MKKSNQKFRLPRAMARAGVMCFLWLSASPAFSAERKITTFNEGWEFSFGTDSTTREKVILPHCWNGDAYLTRDYRRGAGRYAKQIKGAAKDRRTYLRLDGAAAKSEVRIDGRKVGRHVGAYSSHTLDITPYVSDGGEHTLEVIVDNSDKSVPPYSADFTFMGGLYRDAWVIETPALHLDLTSGPECGFKVTPSVSASGDCSLSVGGTVVNDAAGKEKAEIEVKISDEAGRAIATQKISVKLNAGATGDWRADFSNLKGVELWSPESPTLYRVDVSVSDGKGNADRGEVLTGFRTYGFDDQGRFLLNGQPLKLRGLCRHQDQAPMGYALTDEMHRRDMQMIKDMGANFIRISHYPQDEAVLEMCDRLGLIAWEEVPVIDFVPDDAAFADNAETMLREMIARHYNHPSVAMWGYMNEILLRVPGEGREATVERTRKLANRLQNVLREADDTRLSTMAFHGSDQYNETGLSGITDVQGWNLYQGWYGGTFPGFEEYLSRQHREHPDHHLIVSEYGAGSDLRLHSLKPAAFDFSMEYQQAYLEHYLPVIEDSAFVAGASHWNFIDFSSANRAESMPHINNKGLVTNDRRKKDVYYYFSALWHDVARDTVAHIATRDWAEQTDIAGENGGVARDIKVYTNLPEAKLRVNGVVCPTVAVKNRTAKIPVTLRYGLNVLELLGTDGRVADCATINLKTIGNRDGRLDLGTDELAVNVGSDCYFRADASGLTWLPDREYAPGALYGHTGGERRTSQDLISCTDDQPLLQHCLTGLEEYRFDVAPGRYEVELYFAELAKPSAASAYMLGRNSGTAAETTGMDITINGVEASKDYAPGQTAGEKTAAMTRHFAEVGDDGALRVAFTPNSGATSLSAIKIRKL